MIIPRQKDNGFNVREAFESALDEKEVYWTQSRVPIDASNAKPDTASFCCQLSDCFGSRLKCNPGVQIDFRGQRVKENPLQTAFKMSPKSTSMAFEGNEGRIEFEFVSESNEEKEREVLEESSEYLIVQVLDNEIERGSKDRVIAECLLTFSGFDKSEANYCDVLIYDSVKEDVAGHIVLSGSLTPTGSLLIFVEEIVDLSDPTADLVKDDSTARRDGLILAAWSMYMILSIVFYVYGEDFLFIDALYLRIVTAFTVGYGDMFPVTNLGKLLNCLFIVVDSIAIGFLTSKVMNYILRFREIQKEKRENAKRRAAAKEREKGNEATQQSEERKDEAESNDDVLAVFGDAVETAMDEMGEELFEVAKETKEAASNFWAKNKLYILGGIILAFIVGGTLFMVFVEGQDAASAFEWNFVTLSTVGYGDVTPHSHGGKVFAIFYIIFGVSFVVMFGTAIFEKVDENRQRKFKQSVMRRALISEAQLLEFDQDGDGKIDKYEFLSKMLVETQEVEQTKIDEIMTKFKMLDADNSGEITVAELREIEGN